MVRPRLTRVLIAPVALSTIAAGLVLVPTMSSAGASTSEKIASARVQLAKLETRASIANENYDAGRIALANANRDAKAKQAKAAASAARLSKAKAAVAAIASAAYSQGATGDTTLLYQGSDPAGFVDRAAIVDSLSRSDVSVLASVHSAQLDADSTAKAAAQAVAKANAAVKKLASEKALVESAAKAENTLLDNLIVQRQAEIRAAQIALAKAIKAKRAADIRRYELARAAAIQARNDLQRRRDAQRRATHTFSSDSGSGGDSSGSGSGSSGSGSSGSGSSGSGSSGSGSSGSGSSGSGNGGSIGSGSSGSGNGGSSGGSGNGGSGSGNSGSIGGSSGGSSAAATAVHWAYNEIGKSYVYGAGGPNHFDCSGLTAYVYARAGIFLPHSSAAQYGSGRHVSRSELRPGDLVFFGSPIHHVGIYVGNGDMINAPQTGENVRTASIGRGDYAGAVRVSG